MTTEATPSPLPPIVERPTCRTCGRPLAPVVHAIWGSTLAEAYEAAADAAGVAEYDLRVTRISRVEHKRWMSTGGGDGDGDFVTVPRFRLDYWEGRFGYHGSDQFCTRRCRAGPEQHPRRPAGWSGGVILNLNGDDAMKSDLGRCMHCPARLVVNINKAKKAGEVIYPECGYRYEFKRKPKPRKKAKVTP